MRGGIVAEVHDALPRAGHAQRIAIALDKAIDKVHLALGVLGPHDAVFIKGFERTGGVELNQFFDIVALRARLGHFLGLLQPVDNVDDGL